jgi:hypothetical protein
MKAEIRCPSTAELVSIWEIGLGHPGHNRALLLLGCVISGVAESDLAHWSIGRRDAALFRLRRMLFGEALNSMARCPHCMAQVELAFRVADIWSEDGRTPEGEGVIEADGFRVSFRVPNSTDLEAARLMRDVEAARHCLLERCILSVGREAEGDSRTMPASIEARVVAAIAARDPDADRRIVVICQECGESWEEIFDVATWLSEEIEMFVRRILREVHSLASAYGWREGDILAMTPTRRQLYINILSQACV